MNSEPEGALIKLTVLDKKGESVLSVLNDLSVHSTVQEVKIKLAGKGLGYGDFQRIQLKDNDTKVPLRNNTKLEDLRIINSELNVVYSDLGPQISWRTTYIIEYTVALVAYPIFYWRPSIILSKIVFHSFHNIPSREIALACWILHYVKRITESIWVHRFSNDTMPLSSLIRNTFYYGLNAASIGYFVNDPYRFWPSYGLFQTLVSLSIFILAEYSNGECHLLLRDIRPPGSKVKAIPKPNASFPTKLFNYVSCPHYFYESMSWFSFAIFTQHWSSFLFWIFGTIIMSNWAIKKHKLYKKQFEDYPRQRKAIFPFIV